MNKPTILVFIDYYLPGFKAGGPQLTLRNLVDSLGEEINFKIVTHDRDLGDRVAYPGIKLNEWRRVGKADVFYTPLDRLSLLSCVRLIRATAHDAIYLNSVFSHSATFPVLLLRRLGLLGNRTVILRPRGELNAGALAIKRRKKSVFLKLAKAMGHYTGIVWHVSSAEERDDVLEEFGEREDVRIATNIRTIEPSLPQDRPAKQSGELKIIFLSRISPKKNLAVALSALRDLRGRIEMNIYGPSEDSAYVEHCRRIARRLPANIEVRFHGAIRPEDVGAVLQVHHLMLFPTLGENFGHVIFEALANGCPVLTSDRTPWRDLEQTECGWSVSLDRAEEFESRLRKCLDMDATTFARMSRAASARAAAYARDSDAVEQNRALLLGAIGSDAALDGFLVAHATD